VNHLNRTFFARSASGILVISHTITNQIEELTGNLHPPIYEFLPTYCCDQFDSVRPPPGERRPFRVFFAGRIERNKGVFGLLEIAKRFYHEGRNEIEFDLAGDGSSLAQLHHATSEAGETINQRFRFHGKVNKDQMLELLSRAHVVIVPTTSDFVEGFNKVVAEGVLSGRPVITSNVCPALEYVREAVVEVPPDDFQAYGNAILQLCDDKAFYEEKVAGCRDAQDQFYDSSRGWGAMLKAGLLATGLPRQERN
jgi:glycosyltransferase involved in cell wall biosynthesis